MGAHLCRLICPPVSSVRSIAAMILPYHSGVNVGDIVACSSAPANASHLCTTGCHVISVHSSSMNATGCSLLLIVSLLWAYPWCILLALATRAFFSLAHILVVYLRKALRTTEFSLLVYLVKFVMTLSGKFNYMNFQIIACSSARLLGSV